LKTLLYNILILSLLFLLLAYFSEKTGLFRQDNLPVQEQTRQTTDAENANENSLAEKQLWAAEKPEFTTSSQLLDSLQSLVSQGRRNAIVSAAEEMAPAVVSVNVIQTKVVTQAYRDWFGLFYQPSRRKVENMGSGFIINAKGYILTNEHVVHGAVEITVNTNDGESYPAEIVGLDKNTDLALLKIDPKDKTLSMARLGDSDDLYIGEWAIALGSPFGLLLDDPQPTVTVGVVSAVGRDILPSKEEEDRVYANMIQTDAAINPGNSGGPLVNALGEVVGINTFIFTPSGGSVGIGFAIPINRAKLIADELIRGGKVRKPWLGIRTQNLTRDLLLSMGYDNSRQIQGVLVSGVATYSPAAQNNLLRAGDIITRLDSRSVRSENDWAGEMIDVRVGKPVSLELLRGGKPVKVSLIPEEQPLDKLKRHDSGIGFELVDLTPEVRSQLGVRMEHGAVVVNLTDQQLERTGSILVQDVLFQINRTGVTGATQAIEVLNGLPRGRTAVLLLERNGRRIRRYLTG
jgi:serine protease Do